MPVSDGFKRMIRGFLLMTVCCAITYASASDASERGGGYYVFCLGPAFLGLADFCIGLREWVSDRRSMRRWRRY